ncbi:MAG TPA: hypothetical protein VHX88_03225 [Solirubrobacteraceae bacterium]|nr:hypothetical protein [Solirubrobacteraceae bacterium]
MPEVTLATVAPRPTAVIATMTSWSEFGALWPGLLEQARAPLPPEERSALNVMLYLDERPSAEVGPLRATAPAAGGARRRLDPARRAGRAAAPARGSRPPIARSASTTGRPASRSPARAGRSTGTGARTPPSLETVVGYLLR